MRATMQFKVEATKEQGGARAGLLATPHGVVHTPTLCVPAADGAVQSLAPDELREVGAELIGTSALLLALRPGLDVIERLGGLHGFMGWAGPILCDSPTPNDGPLAPGLWPTEEGQGRSRLKADAQALTYISPLDGSSHRLSPEQWVSAGERMGADLLVALPWPGGREGPLRYTQAWAVRGLAARAQAAQGLLGPVPVGLGKSGIVARTVGVLNFDGFGLLLPEAATGPHLPRVLKSILQPLPTDKLRYASGFVGLRGLHQLVAHGIDLVQTEEPIRLARQGMLYTPDGLLHLLEPARRLEVGAVDATCPCYTCTHFSRAFLWHLFEARELLAYRLAALHNLAFMLALLRRARAEVLGSSVPC